MEQVLTSPNTLSDFFGHPKVQSIKTMEDLIVLTGADRSKLDFTPSSHQLDYFKALALPFYYPELPPVNIRLVAVAGSGKSFCISKGLHFLPETVRNNTAVVCFNKAIKEEMQNKLTKEGLAGVYVNNIHSIGMGYLKNNLTSHYRKLGASATEIREKANFSLDNRKAQKVATEFVSPEVESRKSDSEFNAKTYSDNVIRLVNLGRSYLTSKKLQEIASNYRMALEGNEPEVAAEVIKAMTLNTSTIDFADMLWLPNVLHAKTGWTFDKYQLVIVDEAQDLSKAQREIVLKMVSTNGRFIAVGDPKQMITSFAGADAASWNALGKIGQYNVDMPLTVSYRCGKGMEKLVNDHVPYFQVHENNVGLKVENLGDLKRLSFNDLKEGDFVICRNTSPLISVCLRLISQKKKATILGTEIAENLIGFIKTHTKNRSDMNAVLSSMWESYDKAVEKLISSGMDYEEAQEQPHISNMELRINCISVISEEASTPKEAETVLRKIFKSKGEGITLMTGHKSKGLEADRIFVLDPHLLPAKMAKSPVEVEQEKNLRYVIYTRAKKFVGHLSSDEL